MSPIPSVGMVTGAGSGIGRAVALRLAEEGMAIGVVDNRRDGAEATVGAVRQRGGQAISVVCDVGCREAVNEAVAKIEDELGPLGAQVNSAGIWQSRSFLEITEGDWNAVMRVNATGLFFCVQAAGRVMVLRKHGAIVNISSAVGGRTGRPFHAHYAASKAAVISITRSAALALGPNGIRVNAVCPGAIDTPMFTQVLAQPQDIIAPLLERIPLGRVGQPSEVASAVSFLLSNEASYVNGQSLNVCGGLQMD
jgi:NAD(P)-dependent dehydrogenase (short-subunit alcohol dehydrogenase family)